MYALIDCNNFYASCERLFRPDLHNKPIIVLSSNDGCVIARSNEAKKLGIPMGEPYFKIKLFCKQKNISVFSSNFALYGDLSARIMATIKQQWPAMEIYSIDEAFLDLSQMPLSQQNIFCTYLQKVILQNTGIPTSIGIGETKTLAKAANYICKKILYTPVFHLHQQQEWLKKIPIGEVWGVGSQYQKMLKNIGICTAYDLATAKLTNYRTQWNISLLRTAMELRGIICIQTPEKHHKSIMSSKSFETIQTDFAILAQALSTHCTRAYEKLRAQGLITHAITIFIQTQLYQESTTQYHNAIEIKLPTPTDDLRNITTQAKKGLLEIYKAGFEYKKVGVKFNQLTPKYSRPSQTTQLPLFDQLESNTYKNNTEQLMSVIDKIKQKFGRNAIKLGAEGCNSTWLPASTMRSPCYTTRWSDLPRVR